MKYENSDDSITSVYESREEMSLVHKHLLPSTNTFKCHTIQQKGHVQGNILRKYCPMLTLHRRGARSRATTTTISTSVENVIV